jgi:hypothetical protein
MGSGRPARGPAAFAVVLVLATSAPAAAGGQPPVHLLLPLLATVAVGRSMLTYGPDGVPDGASSIRGRSTFLSLLPASLTIPDLYAVDVGEREPHRFAAPVDRTTYGSFNLLPARFAQGGRALSVAYASESPPALRDTSSLVRIQFELEF